MRGKVSPYTGSAEEPVLTVECARPSLPSIFPSFFCHRFLCSKPSKTPPKNHPQTIQKSKKSDHFVVSFLDPIFESFSSGFFADFKGLEPLKIVLPLERELNFYKIDIFDFKQKSIKKSSKFAIQNPQFRVQNRQKIDKNRCQKRI